jgi:hypothetical protein
LFQKKTFALRKKSETKKIQAIPRNTWNKKKKNAVRKKTYLAKSSIHARHPQHEVGPRQKMLGDLLVDAEYGVCSRCIYQTYFAEPVHGKGEDPSLFALRGRDFGDTIPARD